MSWKSLAATLTLSGCSFALLVLRQTRKSLRRCAIAINEDVAYVSPVRRTRASIEVIKAPEVIHP